MGLDDVGRLRPGLGEVFPWLLEIPTPSLGWNPKGPEASFLQNSRINCLRAVRVKHSITLRSGLGLTASHGALA